MLGTLMIPRNWYRNIERAVDHDAIYGTVHFYGRMRITGKQMAVATNAQLRALIDQELQYLGNDMYRHLTAIARQEPGEPMWEETRKYLTLDNA